MPTKILTSSELDILCQNILLNASHFDSRYKIHLTLMYGFGLRISETLLTEGLYKAENGNILVLMPKTGYTRILPTNQFSESIDFNLLYSLNNQSCINKKSLERLIKSHVPYYSLKCGNKGINSHLFRHNYAKKAFNQLQSYTAVNELLQEKTLSICKDYCNSLITY